ncbi:MAG: T9SS type A sorting domain-containing protein [Candidatus Cloacimonetes bacterium]|nr:T9SS type A sorting domain-containing protein [Candidatus Cloacimonadota bacterium]
MFRNFFCQTTLCAFSDTVKFTLPKNDSFKIVRLHNHRVWDGDGDGVAIIDMGCYEFGAEPYVEVTQNQIPNTQYQLTNYPNPFDPETKIVFNLPEEGDVKLEIYNIKGQKVKTLLDCYMSPGRSEMIWNGKDDNGKPVSSGVYFYQLVTEKKTITKKMILIK